MSAPWSKSEFRLLKHCVGQGLTAQQITARISRSRNAIVAKADRHGLIFARSKR